MQSGYRYACDAGDIRVTIAQHRALVKLRCINTVERGNATRSHSLCSPLMTSSVHDRLHKKTDEASTSLNEEDIHPERDPHVYSTFLFLTV